MEPAEIVKLALQVSIMLTVFGFGLRATVQDALYLVRHPRMLVISLVSMLIVMPFIALALVLVFDPPQLARVALVALALSPVPPILLTRQRKAGGQASYGLGLTAAVAAIIVLTVLGLAFGHLLAGPDPGILRCWPSPALSGTRASPGGRGRELPVAGCRGGDHPVSAHRRRRVHSLHQADA